MSRNVCYRSVYCCLIKHSLSRFALITVLRTSADEFDTKWTHILLVDKPCSNVRSFCASGVSSGLATRVSRGRFLETVTRIGPCSDFIFVMLYVIVGGLHFKWQALYSLGHPGQAIGRLKLLHRPRLIVYRAGFKPMIHERSTKMYNQCHCDQTCN
jgi:hypothetical protein